MPRLEVELDPTTTRDFVRAWAEMAQRGEVPEGVRNIVRRTIREHRERLLAELQEEEARQRVA